MDEPEKSNLDVNLSEPDGWEQLGKAANVYASEAGLVSLGGLPCELAVMMAAGFAVLKHIGLVGSEEPRYSSVGILIPPGPSGDRCRAETVKLIPDVMKSLGASPLVVVFSPLIVTVRSLVSLSAPDLVQVIEGLPDDSAWFIVYPELYRDSGLASAPSDEPESFLQVSLRHLNSLIEKLSEVALRKRLLLVFAVDRTRTIFPEIEAPETIGHVSFSTLGEREEEISDTDVGHLRELFRGGGWPAVQADPKSNSSLEPVLARALAHEFQSEGDLSLVWQVMEPFSSGASNFTTANQLALAYAARTAGHMEAAVLLLKGAIEGGAAALEELHAGSTLAYDLSQLQLLEQIAGLMRRNYPESALTRRAMVCVLFEKRDFASAIEIFDQLGDPVGVAQCHAYLSDPFDPEPYLVEMEKEGRREIGLVNCAEEAMHRGDYLGSLDIASQVPSGHESFASALKTRARALRRGLTAKREGSGTRSEPVELPHPWLPPPPVEKLQTQEEFNRVVAHLISFMRVAARYPDVSELRAPVESLLEHQLEEPLVMAHLAAVLVSLAGEQSAFDDKVFENHKARLTAQDWSKGLQTEDEFRGFMDDFSALLSENPGSHIKLGEGVVSAEFTAAVGPKLIDFVASLTLEVIAPDTDWEDASWPLHLVCLCCREGGDAVTDLTLIQSTIDRLATFGAAQEARNLAETALQHLPPLQPEHLEWRISQGWAAMAEACARTGNQMAALRYLCFSFLVSGQLSPSVELQRRRLRMAARIFRDLNACPFSMIFIGLERQLLTMAGVLEPELIPLEVLEMQLRLKLGASESELVAMFRRSQELAELNTESERYSLLTVQASIIFQLGPQKCPADLVEYFKGRVDDLPPNLKDLISLTTLAVPSVEEISRLLVGLPDAQDHDYLSYQMVNAMPAFVRALQHAESSGDQELFLMTAGVFAQPALSVRASKGAGEVSPRNGNPTVQTTTVEGLKAGKIVYIPRYSFAPLAEISLAGLQASACEGEEILIIAGEPSAIPHVLTVSTTQAVGPVVLSSWSVVEFARWRTTFIDNLYWKKPAGYLPGFDPIEEPPIEEVQNEFAGLELGRQNLPEYLTIVPPGHLFGFAWQLSAHQGKFLGEFTKVAIAPSAGWLMAARSEAWAGSTARRAWLGSRTTPDATLVALKQKVAGELEDRNFIIADGAAPSGFEGCDIAFIAAHGGTGEADYFRAAGDRIFHYSPAEMAHMLKNCGCVILAVCRGVGVIVRREAARRSGSSAACFARACDALWHHHGRSILRSLNTGCQHS